MFGQDSSPLITYAIPFFMLLVGIEFIYGLIKRENNYRINQGLLSIIPLIKRLTNLLKLKIKLVKSISQFDIIKIDKFNKYLKIIIKQIKNYYI